jgi:arginine-tRNA-protein transferase
MTQFNIQFYATAQHPCGYFDNRLARSQVATPSQLISADEYSYLVQHGFRRSGEFIYRPYCDDCQACIPVRINVADFAPNRSQRRAFTQHKNLIANVREPIFIPEHYALYQRYQHARHPHGGMTEDNPEQYEQSLLISRVTTQLVEFRNAKRELKMVSLIDILSDGYSSVYTFYEPEKSTSYGTYNVLWQIEQVRKTGLAYLYLGYWIKANRKMAYKSNFRPFEAYVANQWGTVI